MTKDSHGLVAGLAGFGISQSIPFDVGKWLAHFATSVAVGVTVWAISVFLQWIWKLIRSWKCGRRSKP